MDHYLMDHYLLGPLSPLEKQDKILTSWLLPIVEIKIGVPTMKSSQTVETRRWPKILVNKD